MITTLGFPSIYQLFVESVAFRKTEVCGTKIKAEGILELRLLSSKASCTVHEGKKLMQEESLGGSKELQVCRSSSCYLHFITFKPTCG